MAIPVRNIYFMLCYAWDVLRTAGTERVQKLNLDSTANLLASVLEAGMRDLLRRGVDRGYVAYTEETPRLRGRIDLMRSHSTGAIDRGRAVCTFDDLSYDIQHNRILAAACQQLLRVPHLDNKLRPGLRRVTADFPVVTPIRLEPGQFKRIQVHGNNASYRLLLNIAWLVMELTVLSEDGDLDLQDFDRDEHRMRILFEKFVANFYRHHRSEHGFKVHAQKALKWWDLEADEFDLRFLPGMSADIVMTNSERVVVLDTKFSKSTLTDGWHGGKRIKSGHLYQLTAYMRAVAFLHPAKAIEGILLYPATSARVSLKYRVGGMTVRIETVDMAADEATITERLLQVLVGAKESQVRWLN